MSFYAGQQVRIFNSSRFDGLATVAKVLQKNVDVVTADGRRVRVHPSFLTTDLAEPVAATAALPALAPCVGTVVRAVSGNDPRFTGVHVVVGEGFRRGVTCVKVAKLGGDAGRTWSVPLQWVEVVPLRELPAELSGVLA